MDPENIAPAVTPRALPPVILHPFDTRPESSSLAEAAVGCDAETSYFQARYAELRMLAFLGKDLDRWLSQCVEMTRGQSGMEDVREASFISLLLFEPPPAVTRKMTEWGVGNYQIVFSRALGLNLVYPFPPSARGVSEPLLRNFHVYADALFDLRLKGGEAKELSGRDYTFDIYASSEYSKLLERSWAAPES